MYREKILEWGFRIIAAVILLRALFYKFTGHPDSVALFGELSVEPWGRIALGVLELFTVMLLLVPETVKYGIVLGLGLMGGAIMTHLFIIGISFRDDGGRLFFLALTCTACLLALAYRHRTELRGWLRGYKSV